MVAKKKILIRIGSLRHGGAEKVLVAFLKIYYKLGPAEIKRLPSSSKFTFAKRLS